jgi:hypothetical protein
VCVAAAVTVIAPPSAGAVGEGGASTRVVGRGNIVTSILGWSGGGARPSSGTPPACAWRTLTDAQLEWLVSVAAQAVGLGLSTPLLDPLRPYLHGAELPDGDLQGYVCGWDTYELRFVPATAERSVREVLYRQMITRPSPERLSLPAATVVPAGQPVFVSIERSLWQPVEGRHPRGVTAQVRAEPSVSAPSRAIPLRDGELTVRRPFVGGSPGPPRAGPRAEACTVVFRSACRAIGRHGPATAATTADPTPGWARSPCCGPRSGGSVTDRGSTSAPSPHPPRRALGPGPHDVVAGPRLSHATTTRRPTAPRG